MKYYLFYINYIEFYPYLQGDWFEGLKEGQGKLTINNGSYYIVNFIQLGII